MQYEHLIVDLEGPVATVALNRPEVRNALDDHTIAELGDCFRQLAAKGGLRAAVLRGAGPGFCAGADVRWMRRAAGYGPARNRKDAGRLVRMLEAVDRCPLPVIGRVHGGVYGGGLGLVAACDIVVAESGSRMSFSECRLGILPAVISSFVLPKIGPSHARRLYLTGEVFGMELARRIGLVHETVPEAELDARVRSFIESILKNGPAAVGLSKAYIRKMGTLSSHPARVKASLDALAKARSSEEGKEGLTAFLEKRPPSW